MATITFKPIRSKSGAADEVYTVTIGGALANTALVPADEPFTTEEDGDEDMFTPVRTQSGYLRFVATDNTWKALLPQNDKDRTVVLTNAAGTVLWQGYMQAQTFGSELYGYRDEVELPVQCGLTVLSTIEVPSNSNQLADIWSLHNVGWLLHYLLGQTGLTWNTVYVQGGADARTWLLKKFDWQNFVTESNDTQITEDNNGLTSRYNLLEVLEDVCRFWGWTARTRGRDVYLLSADDNSEPDLLELSYSELDSMTGSSGSVTNYSTQALSGDIFATIENENMLLRGANKATVSAEVNPQDTVFKFADFVQEKAMGDNWSWVDGDEDRVGYFGTVLTQDTLTSSKMEARVVTTTSTYPTGFQRRQIYRDSNSDNAEYVDVICIGGRHTSDQDSSPTVYVRLTSQRAMMFGGGSIKITGSVLNGAQLQTDANELTARLGIGTSYASAQWFYCSMVGILGIAAGWSNSQIIFRIKCENGQLVTAALLHGEAYSFASIPVADGLYGYIYLELCGSGWNNIEIGNLTIEYSRDGVSMPQYISQIRPRSLIKERVDRREYTASNQNMTQDEWNADCIWASDNNMEYGYGLLMNPDGSYMETAPYGNNSEQPEQHLANRVANYWAANKRCITCGLRTDVAAVGAVSPVTKVTLDDTTFYPASISNDWRDDVTWLKLIEI